MGNYELKRFQSAEDLAQAAAEAWIASLTSAPAKAGTTSEYFAAFSGGRIARNFCHALANKGIPKQPAIHFFWADERCVPATDPESNYHLISEELLIPARIPGERIHRIRGEAPPTDAARLAEEE